MTAPKSAKKSPKNMAAEYAYSFAPKAFDDLEAVLYYIGRELQNPKAARDLAAKIFRGIDGVRAFPDSGAKVDNPYITDQSLRKFFADNYIVFYKPEHDRKEIVIVRIVYGRRNIDEILETV